MDNDEGRRADKKKFNTLKRKRHLEGDTIPVEAVTALMNSKRPSKCQEGHESLMEANKQFLEAADELEQSAAQDRLKVVKKLHSKVLMRENVALELIHSTRAASTQKIPKASQSRKERTCSMKHKEGKVGKKAKSVKFVRRCPTCSGEHNNESNYRQHVNICAGKNLYKCIKCGKIVGDKSQLKNHKKSCRA